MVPSANPNSSSNQLRGVAALTSDDVWAVGSYGAQGSSLNLAVHWDGNTWTITPTPKSTLSEADQLKKVVAVSTSDVWSVGGQSAAYTLHWDGAAWTQIPLPAIINRGFQVTSSLEDIAAVSSNDLWMVGSMDARDGTTWTLTMRWDGQQWTQIPSPNVPQPAGSATPFYPQQLDSVVAISPGNVWAAGHYRIDNTAHTLIQHWDGTQWSIVPSPDGPTGDGLLHSIAASAPNDIWAVGEYNKVDLNAYAKGLAMRWNGTSWTVANPPNPSPFGVNALNGLTARGPNNFYAFGTWETSAQGLSSYAVHWDGNGWTQTPSENAPGDGTGSNQFFDAGRDSSGGLWTVGSQQGSSAAPTQTLVERMAETAISLTNVVSRKLHNGIAFDLSLALIGQPSVEPRTADAGGNHTLIFTFAQSLGAVGSAQLTSGAGSVSSSGIDPTDARRYIVNLTGVANAQRTVVTLGNVADTAGNVNASLGVTVDLLAGDVSGDGNVNSGDALQIRNRAGQSVDAANSKFDLNKDGVINVGDVQTVRNRAGTGVQ